MKVFVHFCTYVEHDSLNVYSSEKCFEQDLHKKIHTHIFYPIHISKHYSFIGGQK